MTRPRQKYKLQMLLLTTSIILSALCSGGCAGDRIEYDPPDPNLVGKVIRFKISVAYLVLSDNSTAKLFGFKSVQIDGKEIIRQVVSKREVDAPYSSLHKYPREYIQDGMIFTILGSYLVRQGWIDREFASDYRDVILRDNNGTLSVCSMLFLESESGTVEN